VSGILSPSLLTSGPIILLIYFSHRIRRTYPGPPPEVEGLDQN